MRDAHAGRTPPRRSASVRGLLNVAGFFGLFQRKASRPPGPRVVVETAPPRAPPPAPPRPELHPLRRDLRYPGLHEDVNPSSNVRPAEMTCPNCSRQFRYFQNANGVLTVVHCPGCTRAYRV